MKVYAKKVIADGAERLALIKGLTPVKKEVKDVPAHTIPGKPTRKPELRKEVRKEEE